MLHIWTDGCSNDSPVKPKQKQKERWLSYLILKYSNTSYSLPMNTGDSPPPFGLLEVDYDDRLADARAIYHRTPKKLRTRLKPDPTGASPPIAWAIWIDEDFVVPWYLPLSLLIASIGNVIFAAWYTAESGTVKANGWTIGGGILTAVVTAFNGWVLWAKDSKHPRM
ncbi:hypothetical protein IQ07DRAFT_512442 [Pyrenochaeta sp. DS3sAY3a]|nr:hypothetical protein IQ07DRAFT_512442 [Pyrenochaeta sp. DS3sAY3a]